jgi:hypothetical protein
MLWRESQMNGTRSLFDKLPEDFAPAPDRPDPIIWVRRLVIVAERSPDVEPIRVVEFRRGLNIIATAQPREQVDGPVGHNVGKTLLTRLIRYCLGEQHFARERAREAIAQSLPDAFVVAEITVADQCWVVARPMGTSRSSESACVEASDWRAILAEGVETRRMSHFLETVEQVTTARFGDTPLPHQDRVVRWLDVLGWLSRDQYCRYRDPLQWRTAWTESGTVDLHDEDASVLIRLVMDLLDQDESKLIQRHKQLLSDQTTKRSQVRKLEDDLAKTRQFLEQRLNIDDEMLTDDLFGDAARDRAEAVKVEVQQALDSLAEESGLAKLEEALSQAKQVVARKEQEIETRQADRQTTESELKQHETASDDSLAASLSHLLISCPLPAGECPLKEPSTEPGKRDPFRQMLAQQKGIDLQRLDQLLAELNEQLQQLNRERQTAQKNFDRKESEVAKKRRELETKLWRTSALIEEAEQYRRWQRDLQTATADLARLERQVEESRQSHHTAHEQLARRRQILNSHFNRVIKALMAYESKGRIDIDMRGIHLVLDEQDSVPGEALASETALSLDLACLSASISGLGFLPRFVIHDSPREADLEPHIYARLFEFPGNGSMVWPSVT